MGAWAGQRKEGVCVFVSHKRKEAAEKAREIEGERKTWREGGREGLKGEVNGCHRKPLTHLTVLQRL